MLNLGSGGAIETPENWQMKVLKKGISMIKEI
jgi:hypothetical protein